ncbi:B3 domain-containing protein, partial [Trifolium medium]|nr:B3 domain-containing protein [Trifolium medium]
MFGGENFCEKAASYFIGKCGHAQTKQGDTKAKETNNSVEEINTASNGGVECGSPEKYQRPNSIRTPLLAVPFETTNETTFNAGVESASPKHFMADAVAKTTPVVVPSQTTGKKTKKPVNEVMP